MSTSVFPTVQTSASDLRAALASAEVRETQQGQAFIRFDFRNGEFTFGRNQEDITGDEIIVNTSSFVHGWIIWHANKATKTAKSFTQPMPEPPPPIEGEYPSELRGFQARFEDDPDTVLVFESNSHGGRTGCDNLLVEIKHRALTGSEYLFPVVSLDSESYKSQHGSTIHNPVFTPVRWLNQEGEVEGAQAKLTKQPEPEPQHEPEPRTTLDLTEFSLNGRSEQLEKKTPEPVKRRRRKTAE